MARRWFWIPGTGYLALFFLLPVGAFLLRSVLDPKLGAAQYDRLLHNHAFWITLGNTFRISILTTTICAVVGFAVAIRLATFRRAYANTILLLIVMTVWISLLVRNYAWMVLLGREGIISSTLVGLGIFEHKRSLLFNEVAVLLAMTHVLIPFMIIPTYAAIQAIDPSLIRASENLGARPWQMFRRILLPLSLPGLATGCLLVFTLALGFYVTPAILGGRQQTTLTMLMEIEINEQLNWGYAAAHAVVLIAITAVLFFAYRSKFGIDRLWGQKA